MVLCDIGNTHCHFYDTATGSDYKTPVRSFEPSTVKEDVFYINVNAVLQSRLDALQQWTDLRPYVRWEQYYDTMGIDRIMACEALEEGVIVDAGSAITVDTVKNGHFVGGFIVPGLEAMRQAYRGISPALDRSFNFDLQLDKMPKNTTDAISYGALGLLAERVRSLQLPVYLTGGDAVSLIPLFEQPVHAPLLLFSGMKKIIQKAELC